MAGEKDVEPELALHAAEVADRALGLENITRTVSENDDRQRFPKV